MGNDSSKFTESGTLLGAYAPPLPDVARPPPLEGKRVFKVVVPDGKTSGNTMEIRLPGSGRVATIRIPHRDPPLRAGDSFTHEIPAEINRVIASTLPSLPGALVVESKPIIWSSVSSTFRDFSQKAMGKAVGDLMQQCQAELLSRTIDVGCNVVLGVNMNVTMDSGGETGHSKIVIVTMTGTPCIIVQTSHMPTVEAEAVVIPLTNF